MREQSSSPADAASRDGWSQAARQDGDDWANYLRRVYYCAGALWVMGAGEDVIAALGEVARRHEAGGKKDEPPPLNRP